MMKKMIQWVLAATLICGASVLNSCKDAHAQEDNPAPQVVSTELIRTSQSWDGVELPDYFEGRPELVAVKYVFPAGQKLGWHHHPVMNYGILVRRGDGGYRTPRREPRHEGLHPLHVLPLAEGPAPRRAAPRHSIGIVSIVLPQR